MDQAIEDIKEKSVDGVKEGIKLIGESLTEVSNAIADCKGAVEDVENILSVLKEFSSPYSFAFHVGKDLLVNGVNIIHEISAAIDDCVKKAGTRGHVLNLGHGVMVGTPEESVAHFFEYNRQNSGYKNK